VGRWFLAVWLVALSIESTDLLALMAPDECLELAGDSSATDPCPDVCFRCFCCARTTVMPSLTPKAAPAPALVTPSLRKAGDAERVAHPLDIFHVPKSL
jgi:hypothetical protein